MTMINQKLVDGKYLRLVNLPIVIVVEPLHALDTEGPYVYRIAGTDLQVEEPQGPGSEGIALARLKTLIYMALDNQRG